MKYKTTVHSMMVNKEPEQDKYEALLIINITEPLVGINLNDIAGMPIEFEIGDADDGTKTGGL